MYIEVNCIKCSKPHDMEVGTMVGGDILKAELVGRDLGTCQTCIDSVTVPTDVTWRKSSIPEASAGIIPPRSDMIVSEAAAKVAFDDPHTTKTISQEEARALYPPAPILTVKDVLEARNALVGKEVPNLVAPKLFGPNNMADPSEMDLAEYGEYLKSHKENSMDVRAPDLIQKNDRVSIGSPHPDNLEAITRYDLWCEAQDKRQAKEAEWRKGDQYYVGVMHPDLAADLKKPFTPDEDDDDDEECEHDLLEKDNENQRLVCQDCDESFSTAEVGQQIFFQYSKDHCEHSDWELKDFGHYKQCKNCGLKQGDYKKRGDTIQFSKMHGGAPVTVSGTVDIDKTKSTIPVSGALTDAIKAKQEQFNKELTKNMDGLGAEGLMSTLGKSEEKPAVDSGTEKIWDPIKL